MIRTLTTWREIPPAGRMMIQRFLGALRDSGMRSRKEGNGCQIADDLRTLTPCFISRIPGAVYIWRLEVGGRRERGGHVAS